MKLEELQGSASDLLYRYSKGSISLTCNEEYGWHWTLEESQSDGPVRYAITDEAMYWLQQGDCLEKW